MIKEKEVFLLKKFKESVIRRIVYFLRFKYLEVYYE